MNFLHVFHNLPGHPPNCATLLDLSVVTGGLSADGVYRASFWGTDWAIQPTDPGDAPGSRAARPAQASSQRTCFTVTGDAHTGSASLTCYVNQNRASWERCDLRDVVVGPNAAKGAVVLTFSTADSDGQVGHFVKEIRPIPQGNRRKGLTIQTMMTAMHRARLCTTQQ